MTHCRVLKCTQEVDGIAPMLGPLCAEHFKDLPDSGVEWIFEPSDGMGEPTILVGEHLRGLHEYVLLEAPNKCSSAHSMRVYNPPEPGDNMEVPFRVRRRGETEDAEMTLVITREIMAQIGKFFTDASGR